MLIILILFGLMTHSLGSSSCGPDTQPPKCPITVECRPTCAKPIPDACLIAATPEAATSNVDGCQCLDGYILTDVNGKCVKIEECPRNQSCNGDPHAVIKSRPWACRPTCSKPNNMNSCAFTSMPVGCECETGYILDHDYGKCIKVEDCPGGDPCAPNSTFVESLITCPYHFCPRETSIKRYPCDPVWPSPPGCACKSGYKKLYDEENKCVLESDCPWICPVPQECIQTCANPFPMFDCPDLQPAEKNIDGCQCQKGYILSELGGKCIKIEECPKNQGCNGDPNAVVTYCPWACPATCAQSNTVMCFKQCSPIGCQCAPGYILSEENGKCILPGECKGGDPCGVNATFSYCSHGCPELYCPENDDAQPVCDPIYPCPPGCMCKLNHKRLSRKDERCILSSECPPINCTRPNEVWSPCPSECLAENCENVNEPPKVCYPLVLNCQPKCICAEGYFRNTDGICIPANKCPGYNPCLSKCAPTCAERNPSNCGSKSRNNCCKKGYILSERNGKCIRIQDCPSSRCSKQERYVVNSNSCQKTCANRKYFNTVGACKPFTGCVCKVGFVRLNDDATGPCVRESQCPRQPVCGKNEVATKNKIECPPQTCESIYSTYNCENQNKEPKPGCNCIDGYLRNSKGVCIPSEKCPPPIPGCNGDLNATEKLCPNPCHPTCENPKLNLFCKMVCPKSGCECNPGYLLSNGKCVLPEDCPGRLPVCGKNEVATENKIECPPQTCESIYTSYNCENRNRAPNPGCNCIDGYLRNSKGVCIPSEKCPPPILGCNGDLNATQKLCPNPCHPTCSNPKRNLVCKMVCPESGCECNPGYLLSNGKCVLPEDCPGGGICPANEQYVGCKIDCPNNYCPVNDVRAILICDPRYPCPSGCVCKGGYLRKSTKENYCIEASKCPPVKCTRPNEVWNPNPSPCLRETCEEAVALEEPCIRPNRDLRPQCVCRDGFYRNESDICIPASECPFICPISTECRPTCAVPNPQNCPASQQAKSNIDGCQCQEGYILSEAGGKCIKIEECPQNIGCNGDSNAVVRKCPAACPSTCDQPDNTNCKRACLNVGCQCAPGYLKSADGKCILPSECPGGDPCGPNGRFVQCAFRCPDQYCPKDDTGQTVSCKPGPNCPSGCACRFNYKRKSYDDDRCILASDCPPVNCTRPNEVWSSCPSACLGEDCRNVNDPKSVCYTLILNCQPRCICADGYYRNKLGFCIPANKCPNFNPCLSKCTPTCAEPNPKNCGSASQYKCCPDGQVLTERNGTCINIKKCPNRPPICGKNEVATDDKIICPPQTCQSLYIKYRCKENIKPEPGCNCIKGYLRNSNGVCIPKDQCPPLTPVCGENEIPTDDAEMCPPQSCESIYTSYLCDPNRVPKPGCKCIDGYLRNSANGCIPNEQCPPPPPVCRDNEIATDDSDPCPPQTCASIYTSYFCEGNRTLIPGCKCIDGYLKNARGDCIPSEKCPPPPPICGGPNEISTDDKIVCPPQTCESRYTLYKCDPDREPEPGCNCIKGYLRNSSGVCIPSEQCTPTPQGCNGDLNATEKTCPNPCQPTCTNPNPSGICPRACLVKGCECNPGYLLSNGKCVLPKDCPGGPTCPANEQYVNCRVECPNSYCPVNDNRGIVICDPPYPCPSGCICKSGYLRKSRAENYCIEASKCPPVNCTRPNEVWNPSPPNCLRERCSDANKVQEPCDLPYRNYKPLCVCRDGFYRNDSDICVPAIECPLKCPLTKGCRPTCAVPNPPNCPVIEPVKVNIDGCQCQDGYILSEESGKCIRIEECPQDIGCNGDPYAVVKYRPAPCPSTCSSPDNVNCKRLSTSIGCQCAAPGYIKSTSDGKCIPVDQCPGGDPCGPNGTFVYCGFRCPNQYCPQDDSQFEIACKPGRDCPPGCGCKINYKRLSYEDDRCILASECPPVECTRPNEVWSSCPSDCLAENCENVNDPFTVCNTLLLNCQPKCICAAGYYRNSSGICIPAKECEGYNPCLSKCAPTCANPNPQDCGKEFKNNCCQDGYILSEPNGKCVRIEECPKGCNGDPNAVANRCPSIKPATCKEPQGVNTLEACLSYGCACAPGYIKSESDGKCILPSECPGGDPCGANGTFVPCAFGCPDQYCPRDDNPYQVACMPPYPCPSGCACKTNHKRLSSKDNRCILSSDCPPVKCTRQNEVWSPCPSPCRLEDCRNVNDEPRFCIALAENCQPKCICADGYYRNSSGICVPAKECDGYNPCLSSCAPTCAEPNPSCGKSITTQKNDCCAEGYVLSERNGKCIRVEECPNGCNGDPNAVAKRCPSITPATCKNPRSVNPQEECLTLGCECARGYIKSEIDGQCILPDKCPSGNPCGPNGTFVQCAFRCPDQYCPRNDSPFQVACLPPLNCPAGCACKSNYKRLSTNDDRCILASDCPQAKCTRKNEVWSPCPSNCRSEDCRNVNDEPRFCIALANNCRPRCICIDGYYRNSMGICVPANQCEGYNPCLSECAPTCANPNPSNCDSYVRNSCCREGYILSETRGRCIKIEECPSNVGCNGDPNAVVKTCPTPCPSTCDQPNAFPCKKLCLAVGCQCADGYLQLEAGGKCVKPDECPGGNPCGKNATFLPCRSNCPSTYCPVDDSRAVEDCNVPNPCLSGCVCRVNHRRLSRGDDQCIVSSDCPPVKCTRQNEEWSSCPSACLQESCKDVGKKPVICNTLLLNCQPRCVCSKGYYRNDSDICVSAKECACQ